MGFNVTINGQRVKKRSLVKRFNQWLIDRMGVFGVLFIIGVIAGWGIGFGMNLYKLVHLTAASGMGEIIGRAICIFPFWPLGGIAGWM